MQNSIQSNLIRGHIDTIILSILYENDKYGYEILGEIQAKSGGEYQIKQPTLYSCLKRLESQGFIYSYRGDETESGGGRRKYYALTEMGKDLFRKNQEEWEYSRTVIDRLVSDKIYQFSPILKQISGSFDADVEKTNEDETIDNTTTKTIDTDEDMGNRELKEDLIAQNNNNELLNNDIEQEQMPLTQQNDYRYGRIADNTYDYFSGTESASYIDKVSGIGEVVTEKKIEEEIVSPPHMTKFYDDDEQQSLAEQLAALAFDDKTNSPNFEDNGESDNYALSKEQPIQDRKPSNFQPYNIKERLENSQADSDEDNQNRSLFDLIEEATTASRERFERERQTKLQDEKERQEKINSRLQNLQANPSYSDFQNNDAVKQPQQQTRYVETEKEIIIGREYKNIIKQLLDGKDNIEAVSYSAPLRSQKLEPAVETKKVGREKVNFDKVSASVRSMGDDIKIRTYNSDSDKKYTNMYYFYPNKLMLYQYGIMFALMIFEIIIPFALIKLIGGINSATDIPLLIVSSLFALAFPAYAAIKNFTDPFKRKRYSLDFRNSVAFRIIVFALLLVIIYAFNVVLKMDVANPVNYLMTLIVPALLSTNVPISIFIFKALYNTQKFAAD